MQDHSINFEFRSKTGKDRRSLNGALSAARNTTMLALLGSPRSSYDAECRGLTNQRILDMMETADFPRFQVVGLRPAIRVLATIMAEIAAEYPALPPQMGTTGMLCCRLVHGSSSAISNHAWGVAIDLTLGTVLDPDTGSQALRALAAIHPIFNRHGFFWGAAFHSEEVAHFEASDQLVRSWADDGAFGAKPATVPAGLGFGDRGTLVEEIQLALNRIIAPAAVWVDGIYGTDTRAVVIEFQRQQGLLPNGICGPAEIAALVPTYPGL